MEVASKVGYSGAGLAHPDLVKVASQYEYGGIRSILADNGIVNFEGNLLSIGSPTVRGDDVRIKREIFS